MSVLRSYFDGMLRYFEFSGRSTRRQYWLFWLVASLAGIGALVADRELYGHWPTFPDRPGPLLAFVLIIHLIPGITVTVRRLHDVGRSGWWYLIQFVPLIGALVLLWWMIRGPSHDNAFGSDPREEEMFATGSRTGGSTIPRQVRMGGAAPRANTQADSAASERFI